MENTKKLSRRSLMGALAAVPLAAWGESPTEPAVTTTTSGRNLLTIDVMLDAKGPFRFVVDTGADRSVVSDAVARVLGQATSGTVMVEGVVRTIPAPIVRIGRLVAGPVERSALDVPVLPHEHLNADGYLGLDVINGYRLSLDFLHRELRLQDPRSVMAVGRDAPHEVPVQLSGNAGHLRAFNCVIDGVRSIAFIDTGAEISVGNAKLYAALTEINSGYAMKEVIPLTGVTGGTVDGRVTSLKRVRLGGITIENSRIAIADLQIFRLWELDDRPALLIGMNWLRRFNRVAIDYGRKELRFDMASSIRKEEPLPCVPSTGGCRYLIGSPNTIPRPSVAM
jgi:predicted aspartyl protease